MIKLQIKLLLALLVSNLTIIFASPASSQITPDNTLGAERSVVTPNTNVRGLPATLIQGGAERGVNLFQSFSQFNVGDGQRVYFANPQGIQNILSRITGGDPSRIFGTLGVDGKANLFFLNPNGIIFGPNARLDVAGSFFASTANSFVFDNGLQFSATNPEAPPLITVSIRPGLQFGANSPTISNTGNLQTGQDLTLAGVKLDLQGKLEAGRDLTLQATDTVKVRDTATNPFIASAGGKLLLQGNQNVDIFALNNSNSGFFSGSDMVLRSASTVGGDAHYWANGNFRIEKLDGNLGNLFSPFDPVIRASGDVSLGNYEGASLHILAGGSVTFGDVTITGVDQAANTINPTSTPNLATVSLLDGTTETIDGCCQPTLDVRAGIDWSKLGGTPVNSAGGTNAVFSATPTAANISAGNITNNNDDSLVILTNRFNPNTSLQNNSITVKNINLSLFNGNTGNVIIDAIGDINTENIDTFVDVNGKGNAGNIRLFSEQGAISTIKTVNGALNASVQEGRGGRIQLIADKDISTAEIRTFSNTTTLSESSGDISINSKNGSIDTTKGKLISSTDDGYAGNIRLEANGNISVGTIETFSNKNGRAGDVTITNTNGKFLLLDNTISSRTSESEETGGDIQIEAGDINIQRSQINSNTNNRNISSPSFISLLATKGSVVIEQSTLSTTNQGLGFSGNISISARDKVSINSSNLLSEGNFGIISIGESENYASFSPKQVEIINGSKLSTTNLTPSRRGKENTTDRGFIFINADSLVMNSSSIETNTRTEKNAGNITINTTNGGVDLNNSSISSQVLSGENLLPRDILNPQPEEFRNGGDINITARSFKLDNNSQINAFVNSGNSDLNAQDRPFGNAGNININVGSGNFEINAAPNSTGITGIFSTLGNGAEVGFTNATGRGGDITITSGSMSINGTTNETRANAGIAAKTFGIGNAGKIQINTGSLTVQNGGFIDNGTTRNGNGGPINITAQSINLANDNPNRRAIQSVVQAGTEKGNGGDIFINTGSLSLSNAAIDASTFGNGNAGIINITANNFEVRDGGQVRSSTNTSGEAGGIKLTVTDNITLSGSRQSNNLEDQNIYYLDNNLIPSGVFATTGESSTGKGGNISIDPELVTIEDGARIAVDSRGSGDAGQINLEANRLILDQGSITANTNNGNGGDITLSLKDLLLMRRDSLISTTAGQGNGNGGNITINGVPNSSPFIVTVPGENNDIIANARTGRDGRVTINGDGAFGFNALSRGDLERLDPINQNPRNLQTSDITAISSQSPVINQQDNLNSPESEISDTPINLPQNTVDASRLVPQRCEAFAGRGSQFINTGRGGLPPRPDTPLNSDAVWKDTRLTTTPTQQKIPTATNTTRRTAAAPIIPATAWVFNGKGEVTLVSKAPGNNSSLFNNTPICPVP